MHMAHAPEPKIEATNVVVFMPQTTKRSCKNNFRVFGIVPQRDRDLAQNPKSETRNPKQTRRSEIRIAKPGRLAPFRALELFRILNLFRISDSGLRISRASNAGWPGVRIPPGSRILFLHRPLASHPLPPVPWPPRNLDIARLRTVAPHARSLPERELLPQLIHTRLS